ncbi:site-specific integrase [Flavobacterium sp. Leaf359]|uniref:site-specific integrase n=1 Tax=Flavobacterium sp. Leaf359 TaxID=1736351 RepID=UPI0006F657CD|nr:site-specific integrase [Flavobacterium sp. Leaf359]KQS53561.1 tyrosine type site-specific recombinase [Flavobacterium sp. Leaf359]
MVKVIFYIKAQKANKMGEAPIFARISFKTQETAIATGKSISLERWQQTAKLRNVLKIEKEKVIKNALDIFQLAVEKKFNELYKIDPEVSLSLLKKELSGKASAKKNPLTMMEVMDKHNSYFKKKVDAGDRSPASLQKYERAKDLLKNFIAKHYHLNDINTSDVNGAFVHNLEEYLTYDSIYKGRKGIKNNSVVKYIKSYKTACNHCIKLDLLDKNPFNVYQGRLSIKDAVFLTQDELKMIEDKTISFERLRKVRDIFLFSCYTGYAPVDAAKLTQENILKGNNGELWLITTRAKTSIRANVPVLPPALKVIEKYSGQQKALIPTISNQKMNAYLKELADICGIEKHLTWYVARHTFGTTVTLGNGVRIENVSSMMGHTNIKQTQHYAKVLDHNVMNDMHKVIELYK